MKLSILVIFVLVFCLQQEVVGGKKKQWTVESGWEKKFTNSEENYLFSVVQSNYEKYDNYGDIAKGIRKQIYNENNGTKYNVLIGKKKSGTYAVWTSRSITFYYKKFFYYLFQKN